MDISIYVATHKEVAKIDNLIFKLIHVGKANSDVEIKNVLYDNLGVNISHKNSYYCELTALYWAWKNDFSSEYLGLCHYRRFFAKFTYIAYLQAIYNDFRASIYLMIRNKYSLSALGVCCNKRSLLDENIAQFSSDIEKMIAEGFEIFCLTPVKLYGIDVKTFFSTVAGVSHFDVLRDIISDEYKDYLAVYDKVLSGNKLYYANMEIMRRDIFDEYCSFLFDILQKHESLILEKSWCLDLRKEKCFSRLSGYLGEVLTSVFIERKVEQGYRVKKLLKVDYREC